MAPAKKRVPPEARKQAATKPAGKPKRTAKPRSASKPPATAKVPVAVLRALEAALLRDGDPWQVQGLTDALGKLGEARAPAAAKAGLAYTRAGAPIARAFLNALGDGEPASEAANTVVRYCAAMERGRKFLRPAFLAVWRAATDIAAIDAACKNFARGLLDDPALLDVAVDAAAKLGDPGAATALAAKLERATRLGPLLEQLAGAAPQRARAGKQVAELGPQDRWHVYARVVDNPRRFEQELAVDAVCALADDPQVSDLALTPAVADMRDHGIDKLVTAWKMRVAAGDTALITRLLGLFEWTALWATDAEQLEPYIHSLSPAGGRPEVFGSVEHAVAGSSMAAREAVLDHWLRDSEAMRAFGDSQVDKLTRMTLTIAEAGDDTGDRRAANRALAAVQHPGARHALMAAIRNATTVDNDDLRDNLYTGLSRIDHPDILPFLVERMFGEHDEYNALVAAIANRLDGPANLRVLGHLVERARDPNAIHAATVYADALLHDKGSPRLVVDLARVVIGWQPQTNDDARRLRYLFEQATMAALELVRPDDARDCLARARLLPESPYSDYVVKGRDRKTPAAFARPTTKRRIAALEAGKLDAQIAAARAATEAARAAGTPIAANDARLGALAGCKVATRFFEDHDANVVWFFDEVGELHVYDGYAVAPPTFQVVGTGGRSIPPSGMAAFIAGHPMIDERALFITDDAMRARELIRLGDRLLVHDGARRGSARHFPMPAIGLRFSTTAEARHTFARLVANPVPGTRRVDPWYVAGSGAVRRTYDYPLPDGGHGDDGGAQLAVLGRTIDGKLAGKCPALDRSHANGDAAVTAMEAWETRVFAGGGRITELWIDHEATRREDTVLAAFLDQRYRDDDESPAWHLRALDEMYGAIAEAGLAPRVADVRVHVGPPTSAAEIAAYQAVVPEPVPEPLIDLWHEVGGGGFESSQASARLLAPGEIVSRRAALRAWIETRLKGQLRKARLDMLDDLDVIALIGDEPLILFDTRQRQPDGCCFCVATGDLWEKALGWLIATEINALLYRQLQHRVGEIYLLKLGQRASDAARRTQLAKAGKTWEAIVDGSQLLVRASGKAMVMPTIKRLASAEAAAKAFDRVLAAARKQGYR